MKTVSRLIQSIACLWLAVGFASPLHGGVLINSYRFAVSGATDPNFASVVLLLHGNGTNGGTTITDNSSAARTMTPSGNTNTSTAQFKYGTAAVRFDGSGDHLSCPHASAFNFGTGDFTIEFWCRWVSKANFQTAYKMGSAAGSLSIGTGDGNGFFTVTVGGGVTTTETGTQPSIDTWYHFAFVRSSGVIKIYRDGVQTASSTNSGSISQTATINIGSTGSGSSMNAYIDDFRITGGVARYTSSFTPPTAQFPDS